MAKARTLRAILEVEALECREMLSTASWAVSRMLASGMIQRALAPGLPASLPPVANNTQPGAAISLEPPSHDQGNASGITPHLNSPPLFALAMSRQRPGAPLPEPY